MYQLFDVLLHVNTGKRYIVDDIGEGKKLIVYTLKPYAEHQDELIVGGKVIGTIGTTLMRSYDKSEDPDYIVDPAWKRYKKLGQFYNV